MRAGPGRTYRFYTGSPLWPFGFSMSYTSFSVQLLSVVTSGDGTSNGTSGDGTSNGGIAVGAGGLLRNIPTDQPKATFAIKITNTGKVAGAKVVPAFVTAAVPAEASSAGQDQKNRPHSLDAGSGGGGPIRSMVDVQKVFLQPGESATLTLTTNRWPSFCTFCTVDEAGLRAVRPGIYTFQLGGDAAGFRSNLPLAHVNVTLTGPTVPTPM